MNKSRSKLLKLSKSLKIMSLGKESLMIEKMALVIGDMGLGGDGSTKQDRGAYQEERRRSGFGPSERKDIDPASTLKTEIKEMDGNPTQILPRDSVAESGNPKSNDLTSSKQVDIHTHPLAKLIRDYITAMVKLVDKTERMKTAQINNDGPLQDLNDELASLQMGSSMRALEILTPSMVSSAADILRHFDEDLEESEFIVINNPMKPRDLRLVVKEVFNDMSHSFGVVSLDFVKDMLRSLIDVYTDKYNDLTKEPL
jgi:hypothetical protein